VDHDLTTLGNEREICEELLGAQVLRCLTKKKSSLTLINVLSQEKEMHNTAKTHAESSVFYGSGSEFLQVPVPVQTFYKFRFRFRLLTRYSSGSGPLYIDQKSSFQIRKNLAFLHSKLCYKKKIYKFYQTCCKM
jgi:hypothetical protein